MDPGLIVSIIIAITGIISIIIAYLEYRRKKLLKKKKKLVSNIPQHETVFVGRKEETELLLTYLKSRDYLIEITGIGGIGKTSLAIEISNIILKKKIFTSVVFISAKYTPLKVEKLLNAIILYKYELIGKELPIHKAMIEVRKILSSDEVLLIIDNYEEVKDELVLSFLEELPAPSKALITTRHSMVRKGRTLKIRGLHAEDCVKIAQNELSRYRKITLSEDERLIFEAELPKATFGIPFLIKWVIGQMSIGYKYDDIFSGLSQYTSEVEEVYDYVFQKSFQNLDNLDFEILYIVLLCKEPIDYELIEGVCKITEYQSFKNHIDSLVYQNLLEIEIFENYKRVIIHPLTKNYVQFYISKFSYLEEIKNRFCDYIKTKAINSKINEAPSYDFIEKNLNTILFVLNSYIDKKKFLKALELQQALSRYLWVRGYWKIRLDLGKKILPLAELLMEKEYIGRILMDDIGWTIYVLENNSEIAKENINRAKEIFKEINFYYGLVKSSRHLAAISRENGDFDSAWKHYNESKKCIEKIENTNKRKEMEAGFLLSMSKLLIKQEKYESAIIYLDQSIEIFKEINDDLRKLKVTSTKGLLLIKLEKYEVSISILENVINYSKILHRIDQLPIALEGLVEIYVKIRKNRKAKRYLNEAIKAYGALGSQKKIKELKSKYEDLI